MGIIKYGPLAQEVSGSVGGVTFARTSQAKTCRGWRPPVNKRRPAQILQRFLVSYFSSWWFSTLNAAERASWVAYAPTCTFQDALGTNYTISGFNHWVRNAVTADLLGRLGATVAVNKTAPAIGGFPTVPVLTFTLTRATGVLAFTGCAPALAGGEGLLFLVTRLHKISRSFPTGPIFLQTFADVAPAPPFGLHTFAAPLPGAAGQVQLWIRWRYFDANGAVSKTQISNVISI